VTPTLNENNQRTAFSQHEVNDTFKPFLCIVSVVIVKQFFVYIFTHIKLVL